MRDRCGATRPDDSVCGDEPFLHVALEELANGSLASAMLCSDHVRSGRLRTINPMRLPDGRILAHEVAEGCGHPDSVWDFEENVCIVPEGDVFEFATLTGELAPWQAEMILAHFDGGARVTPEDLRPR